MIDAPVYNKPLPQIWIEDDNFIIESNSFRYCISAVNKRGYKSSDPLKLLFKLCRRMTKDSIDSTYIGR